MTTKTLETIKRMNQVELLCDAEIARRIGEKQHIVNRWRKWKNSRPVWDNSKEPFYNWHLFQERGF